MELAVGDHDLAVAAGDVAVAAGDLAVVAGNLVVAAGDLIVDAGDLALAAGDYAVNCPKRIIFIWTCTGRLAGMQCFTPSKNFNIQVLFFFFLFPRYSYKLSSISGSFFRCPYKYYSRKGDSTETFLFPSPRANFFIAADRNSSSNRLGAGLILLSS